MKSMNKYIVNGLACLWLGLFGSCSNLESVELENSVLETEISRATSIEATIESLTAGGLDAALEAKVGSENKYKVTKLKLSGNFNAKDVMTLRKLTTLEDLDMGGITIVQEEDWESNRYEFQAIIWESLENVSEYLNENAIGTYMFAGMTALKNVVLPNTIKYVYHGAFMNCTSLEKVILPANLETLSSYVFRNNKLETLTIPASLKEAENYFFSDNLRLKAVFWESTAKVPAYDNYRLESVLLYVPNEDIIVASSWLNVIANGVAESISIKAKDPWNDKDDVYSFNAPRAFTAKKISYTRYFSNWTHIGEASGWETIVLPFVPTSITHETKGTIAPFNSGISGAKPFWLRSLTANGFVDVTTMEANVPYIIAMPNTDSYIEEYRLEGWVTFSGENVVVPETVYQPEAVKGPEFSLQPSYEFLSESKYIYTLNVRDGMGYNNGSSFVRGGGDVRAFEAYAVLDGRSVSRVIDLDCSSSNTRSADIMNKTGVPQIGDM